VLILWAWTVLLSGLVLFPLYVSSVNAFIPFGVLALGVILFTLFHPSLRRNAEPDEAADPGAPPPGPTPDPAPRSGDAPVEVAAGARDAPA
jgi:UDP-GlcNAc:undecaprenyl-phosphate GlcNAc-1-phosphate transferase